MMPGPTMQSGMEGHSMGHHTHPGDPVGQPGFIPAAMPYPYLHEAYRFGPSFTPFPPEAPARVDNTWLGLDFHNDQFWKGVVLGSLLTILITSETVRETLMKGVAKVWTGTKSGVEELKEKFEDVKAEILYKKKKGKIEEAEKKVEGEGV